MKLGITMLIHNKDDIEFVTEFPCFLGHPVTRPRSVRFLQFEFNPGLFYYSTFELKEFSCHSFSFKTKIIHEKGQIRLESHSLVGK